MYRSVLIYIGLFSCTYRSLISIEIATTHCNTLYSIMQHTAYNATHCNTYGKHNFFHVYKFLFIYIVLLSIQIADELVLLAPGTTSQ